MKKPFVPVVLRPMWLGLEMLRRRRNRKLSPELTAMKEVVYKKQIDKVCLFL